MIQPILTGASYVDRKTKAASDVFTNFIFLLTLPSPFEKGKRGKNMYCTYHQDYFSLELKLEIPGYYFLWKCFGQNVYVHVRHAA